MSLVSEIEAALKALPELARDEWTIEQATDQDTREPYWLIHGALWWRGYNNVIRCDDEATARLIASAPTWLQELLDENAKLRDDFESANRLYGDYSTLYHEAQAKVTELEAERDRYKYWRSTAVADAERSLAELAAERVKVEQLTAAATGVAEGLCDGGWSCYADEVHASELGERLRATLSEGTVGQVTEPQSDCSCGCCRGRACTCDAHSMDEQCRCPYCDYVRREMWHADECSKNHSILRCPYVSESE